MENMCEDHQILWTVTLNDKWQIVIPIEARKRLGLKPWDQLMLLAKWDIALWLVKTSNLQALITMLQEEMKQAQKSKKTSERNASDWLFTKKKRWREDVWRIIAK